LKKKSGFTLLETVITLAIIALVMATAAYLIPNIYTLSNTSSELSQAQSLAQITMIKIEQQLRYANALDIASNLPATPDADFYYIYAQDGGIVLRSGGNSTETLSPTTGFTQYTYAISFARNNEKVVKVNLTIYKDEKQIYTISSRIYANNLLSSSITGIAQGNCVAFQLTLHDTVSVSSITVSSNSSSITVNGQTMQMAATASPANATNKGIAWSVEETDYASITTDGVLTPLKNGTVTVRATALDGSGVIGTKQIMISNQSVTITKLTLASSTGSNRMPYGGNQITIIPTITPSNATNKTLTWSVDNTNYATIDSNGVLTSGAYKNVSVVVTAKTNDGSNITATIEILIKN